jgi:uncharacterized protein (TIGR02118 family)
MAPCKRTGWIDMIKVIYCLRRRADLSPEEFQRYWREIHGPLVRRHQAVLRIKRYVQTHTDHGTLTERLGAFRGSGPPFDGVAEIWYASREPVEEVGRTAEGRAASRELLEDERRFVDLHASCIWVGEEVEMIAGADSRI